jgi:uncharacterized protein (DUF58 family)
VTPVSAPSSASRGRRVVGIATLVLPSAFAWAEAFADPQPGEVTNAVIYALGPLWILLANAVVIRMVGAALRRRRDPSVSILAHVDVLTSSGIALAWVSSVAVMSAIALGWASLAVVGLLGTGLFHVVVLLSFLALRGSDPMRANSISRRFVPEVVTEGEKVVEELHFAGARIPIGFRLFAEGRIGERWATSRHIVDAPEAGAELVLESDVGPAVRGEHEAEPIAVWLQDTFGLCRSTRVHVGAAHLTVLPRVREAVKATPSRARGEGPRAPRTTPQLPTEGFFNLREYQPGDDVRRIHWVRSLAARELIVRMPDELPPDRPRARIVLDTFFPEAATLACDAPAEMLDALVRVWLAVGRALAEAGTRVTLVTAVPQGATFAKTRHDLSLRQLGPAVRLGAQVSWQGQMMVDELLTDEPTLVVSTAMLARAQQGRVRWIAVLPPATDDRQAWPFTSDARMPYPMGSSDNRWLRRRGEAKRIARARQDHERAILTMQGNLGRSLPGSFLAVGTYAGPIHLESLR